VDIDVIDVKGTWWRQTPHGGDPLFRADPASDGRWQRGEVVGALYFADAEDTAWAEWYRALAELAIPPDRQMPRDLWRWEIDVTEVVDLSDGDRLSATGLSPPQPAQRTWPAFQEIGERLWRNGYRGVLAPSAARPRQHILCLFRDAEEVSGAVVLRPPLTYRRAPAPPRGMTT
jgi:RES domain-containing protein